MEDSSSSSSNASNTASSFSSVTSAEVDEEAPIFLCLEGQEHEASKAPSPLLASAPALGIVALLGAGYVFKDEIRHFIDFFITAVDDWGPLGYAAYAVVYAALEVLAVPAIPLTMTAGVIFGPLLGTAIVSVSGTTAAAIAFLIARYAARDKVLKWASKNPRFAAIDRAIGRDGLKFVTLLRLSPLLPLAASNYLYGLTSVDLGSYVLGSWVGMLPGTYAYVSAGHVGAAVLTGEGEGSLGVETWQVVLGIAFTALALAWVGQTAKKAIEEVEAEEEARAADSASSASGSDGK